MELEFFFFSAGSSRSTWKLCETHYENNVGFFCECNCTICKDKCVECKAPSLWKIVDMKSSILFCTWIIHPSPVLLPHISRRYFWEGWAKNAKNINPQNEGTKANFSFILTLHRLMEDFLFCHSYSNHFQFSSQYFGTQNSLVIKSDSWCKIMPRVTLQGKWEA